MKTIFTKTILSVLAAFGFSYSVAQNVPKLFKDLQPGTYGGSPTNFVEVNGTMFFTTQRDSLLKGFLLWKSDGTPANTIMIKGFYLPSSSTPISLGNMCNVNGILYFTFNSSSNWPSDELWKSDGTPAGTIKIKDTKSKVSSLIAVGNKLFFVANNATPGTQANAELWISDGTETGTGQVVDINANGSGVQSSLTHFKGKVYFSGKNTAGVNSGYSSDGTSGGTVTAPCSGGIVYKDELYFHGSDGTNTGLFKTNGTSGGTTFISSGLFAMPVIFKDQLYFLKLGWDPLESTCRHASLSIL